MPAAEPDDTLAFDMPCTACGYNLRASRAGASCPECGQHNIASLKVHVDRATSSAGDGRTLRSMTVAQLRSVVVASVLSLLAAVPALVLLLFPSMAFDGHGFVKTACMTLYLVAMLLSAASYWRLGAAMSRRPRMTVRLATIAFLAFPAYLFAAITWHLHNDALDVTGLVLAATVGLAIAVRAFHQLRWFQGESLGWIGWPRFFVAVYAFLVFVGLPLGLRLHELPSGSMYRPGALRALTGFPIPVGVSIYADRADWEYIRWNFESGYSPPLDTYVILGSQIMPLVSDVTFVFVGLRILRSRN